MENYQIDNLDRGILDALMENARTAYAELAKQFGVSPGTTAAWRLQIVVWQNMSFQSNHPE
ncbi:hypothetical protein LFZ39_21950 [Salmonella enterica subsp. enterica serovar Pullorum]|nr:hypothetical protein LFZ39_21950 [Salmonella enterica subsp. enterica serovar Pullorum]